MLTLNYTFQGDYYHSQGYWTYEEEFEHEYEPSEEDFTKAINKYFGTKLSVEEVMDNYYNDQYDLYLEENKELEEFLMEYFEDKACKEFNEKLEEDNECNKELHCMLTD